MIDREAFQDQVCDSLRALLPAVVAQKQADHAAADAAAGRVVPLAAPATEDYYPGGVAAILRYPTVEVAVPDIRLGDYDIGQHTAIGNVTLVIRVTDSDTTFDTLDRKMNRMASAITDVISDPATILNAGIVSMRGAWRANPETNERDEVVSFAILGFELETEEVRP